MGCTMSAAVQVSVRPPTFTAHMARAARADDLDALLRAGFRHGRKGGRLIDDPAGREARAIVPMVRAGRGFSPVAAFALLTPPDAQHKLDMAAVASYGLTLAHADVSGFELCSWRTAACTQVCVLLNGNGRYDSVQRAWQWRTDLFTQHPRVAVWLLGYELGKSVRKHGRVLFRPDVNSDAAFHRWLPALGTLRGVRVYGYTKNPATLSAQVAGFTYAYSWNEDSDRERVRAHLLAGGRVAVVTSRRKGRPVDADALRAFFNVPDTVRVADADATDEWMLARGRTGIIGDLTAKGKARALVGVSGFVVDVY